MEYVRFNGVSDAYGEFSNFALFPIELDGRTWPTSEHYFQAQKFARTRGLPIRRDWEDVKDDVMRRAVQAKFRQHPSLARMLLDTGNSEIVERTHRDAYWGDGGNGKGKNMLGRILMEVREELRRLGEGAR